MPRELVATRMHRRLFGREATHPHPLLGDAVVLGQQTKRAVAQLVGPRVADVTQRRGRDAVVIDREPEAMTVVPMPK
jgi:hypothetical protein